MLLLDKHSDSLLFHTQSNHYFSFKDYLPWVLNLSVNEFVKINFFKVFCFPFNFVLLGKAVM